LYNDGFLIYHLFDDITSKWTWYFNRK